MTDGFSVWLGLGLLPVLLVLSAFFSGSETALFSLTRAEARRMRNGSPGERKATELLDDPERVLSTILVGNMAVNTLLASVVATLARILFEEQGIGVAIVASTALLLVFGEITPKVIAVQQAPRIARLVAPPLHAVSLVLLPVRAVAQRVANSLLWLLGQPRVGGWGAVTPEQIGAMVAMGESQGVTTRKERVLVENILRLTGTTAHDIMVPRTEIIGLPDSLTVAEAFAAACGHRHSRLPVYHDNLDDSWGIFSVLDIAALRSADVAGKTLAELRGPVRDGTWPGGPVYPAHFFPVTVHLEALLNRMREFRASMVLLVDEYGGTSGLLTMDDILAEVVGGIQPSDEAARAGILPGREATLVDGQTSIRDFTRFLAVHLEAEDAGTVGGYFMEKLGRLPRAGDRIVEDDWVFEVVKMVGRRIGTLRFQPRPAAGKEGPA
ncbi:MAG: Magnesium and cobalt efflux protein CorC [Lentisphaerae bacterium ADurb.BinA184]|nr:MAG: Magnesium and cobalt efflux protein CorC [Lentisphaerae bacterium ADurb.BinA184]